MCVGIIVDIKYESMANYVETVSSIRQSLKWERVMCIRRTYNGEILPIQCATTMRKHVTIIIVPLLYIGSEQSSSLLTMTNATASIYAEHLYLFCEKDDIALLFLIILVSTWSRVRLSFSVLCLTLYPILSSFLNWKINWSLACSPIVYWWVSLYS